MLRISDARLDQLIAEDVPYIDLTTRVLGIGDRAGVMEFFTREPGVVCCTEEAARIMERLGADVDGFVPSGERVEAGCVLLTARCSAEALHMGWKVCLNLLDHYSAVATKTARIVEAAHGAAPHCEVLTTRKSTPGNKDLLVKAVMCGGAFPHRLGLSETVLVFQQHMEFMGGFEGFMAMLPDIKSRCIEKKLFVEADPEQAVALAKAGIDGIQLDKVPAEDARALVAELRSIDPRITIVAAGGINETNAAAYAETGVDGLVTTAAFTAKPLDMSARMCALPADGSSRGNR